MMAPKAPFIGLLIVSCVLGAGVATGVTQQSVAEAGMMSSQADTGEVHATAESSQTGVTVTLSPDTASVQPAESVTLDLYVRGSDAGVQAATITITVTNSSTAATWGGEVTRNFSETSVTGNGTTTTLKGTEGSTKDSGPIWLGSVTVGALRTGSTSVNVTVERLTAETGSHYTVATTDGAVVTVSSAPESAVYEPGSTAAEYDDDIMGRFRSANSVMLR